MLKLLIETYTDLMEGLGGWLMGDNTNGVVLYDEERYLVDFLTWLESGLGLELGDKHAGSSRWKERYAEGYVKYTTSMERGVKNVKK